MKQFFILAISAFAISGQLKAQLTLTRAGQEPAAGDIYQYREYDSSGVVPKATGANQLWNFSSLVQTTVTGTSTYVLPSGVPSSSLFPGTTLVENQGNDEYVFYKSATTPTTQFELVGNYSGTPPFASGITYSNSAIYGIWPLAPGTTYTDTYSGSGVGVGGSVSGTQTVSSSGSGTIVLPGGATYNNIVQLKATRKIITSITIFTLSLTYTTTMTEYMYFHNSQKFPLLTLSYDISDDGSTVDTSLTIRLNRNITVGVQNQTQAVAFALYPNPAKDNLGIRVENLKNEACTVQVLDVNGREVLLRDLGNDAVIDDKLDISALEPGLYVVNTRLGGSVSSKKLVKQ